MNFGRLSPFRLALVAIIAVLVGAGIWRLNRGGGKMSFSTAVVRRGDLASTINSTGTIEPEEVVDVGAQVEGRINTFGKDKDGKMIDYGSTVEEGTILAQIDDSLYASDVALAAAQVDQDKAGELRAAADLAQMAAKAVQAHADWVRAQKLGPSEALAPSAFDSYKANDEIAKANVALDQAALAEAKATTVQAQATLDKARLNLDFCTIRSPVKGVIIDRRVNIGQTVVASLSAPSLFLIAQDLTKMQIWVAVNEADIGRIVPGTPATFTCDAFPGREFDGVVGKVRLNATMTQNVVMYTVEVNTENPDKVLLPYLTANVRFVVKREPNALLVPNAALRWSPSAASEVAPDARSWKPADPRPAGTGGPRSAKPGAGPDVRRGVVWLKDGAFVRPLEVNLGASDGVDTAVTGGQLAEGQVVVVGEDLRTAPAGGNPFAPPPTHR